MREGEGREREGSGRGEGREREGRGLGKGRGSEGSEVRKGFGEGREGRECWGVEGEEKGNR